MLGVESRITTIAWNGERESAIWRDDEPVAYDDDPVASTAFVEAVVWLALVASCWSND